MDATEALRLYTHDVWQVENGLPQDSIQAITQTRDGYLWFGTETGLVRYDGAAFAVFNRKNTNALKDDDVRVLFADPDGTLWIGVRDGGLIQLRDGRFRNIGSGANNLLKVINAIVRDRSGTVWVGSESGLSQVHGDRVVAYEDGTGRFGAPITALLADRRGGLWAGTEANGLARISAEGTLWYTAQKGLSSDRITALFEDREGTIWVGTDGGGLNQIGEKQIAVYGKAQGLPNDSVLSIEQGADKQLWIGTNGGGLVVRENGRFTVYAMNQGLSNDVVLCLYRDREESLWIGTDGGGLNRLKKREFLTYTANDGLAHDRATSVLEGRDGSVWIGTSGGLSRLKAGRFTAYTASDGLASNLVRALLEDDRGDLWIGTDGAGLSRLRKGAFTTYTLKEGLSSGVILSLAQDSAGTLWIGTVRGLCRFERSQVRPAPVSGPMAGRVIPSLLASRNGALWVGTIGSGVYRLENGSWRHYTAADGLPDDFVETMYEDAGGALWLGTSGGGLCRFRDGHFSVLTTRNGLFDDTIFQILEDQQGNLWMSSPRGVFRADKRQLEAAADGTIPWIDSFPYGKADGMKSPECTGLNQPSGWSTRDGRLWFPTIRGVAVVDPRHLTINRTPPPVVVETLVADRKTQPVDGTISLSPGTGQIEVHFGALSFVAPDKVRFKYKLEGLESAWTDAGARRIAFYTNLSPGTYRFRVIACNHNGVWNPSGATLAFTIRPYFYQTPYFYLVCGMLIALSLAVIYRRRTAAIKANEKRLSTLVEQRTRELRDTESRFRVLFADAPLPLFLYDAETLRYIEVNDAAIAHYGYTCDEFLSMGIADICLSEDVARLLDTRCSSRVEDHSLWKHRLKNGDVIDVEITSRIVALGRRTAVLVAAQDVTDRTRYERELTRAKELAEASSRAKSSFLANMSHEIRTPMNGVIGMADLAMEAESPAQQREYLEIVKSSANSLLVVINDILDFSKVEAGKMELDPISFDLERELDHTVRTVALRCQQKGLELLCRVEEGVPRIVVGDAGRLRQVLVNLLGNAMKFTSKGEILLDVRLREYSGKRAVIEFSVKDTGIGIAPDRQEMIFDPFTQEDSSTTRRYGGTGLGLSICRRLVELMDGRIQLESEPGKGSTFSFTVVFGVSDRQPEELPAEPALDGLKGVRVLIVDDNETSRAILTSFVRLWGADSLAVESGPLAIAALEKAHENHTPFDLVILDTQMPGMDGFDVAEGIRSDPALRETAIVMLSSADLKGAIAKQRELGIDSYLTKPVSKPHLMAAIWKWLGKAHLIEKNVPSQPQAPDRLLDAAPVRILLAEDNLVNQRVAVGILKKRGHQVTVANNGKEAVAWFQRSSFDVILMDVQMPEMDGFAATAEIRRLARDSGRSLSIVAMTANTIKGDRERCLEAGMDGYIAKPVNAQELLRLVEEIRYTTWHENADQPRARSEDPEPVTL